MQFRPCLYLAMLFFSMASGSALAQDYDYHPVLSDTFTASLGAMRSSNSFKLESNSGGIDLSDIDFNERLGVSNQSTFFNGQLTWKFGSEKKWRLSAQYFSNDATGRAELEEDIEWEDFIFQQGTFAEAGVKLAVTRAFIGRSFFKNEQNDFGLGVGIHNLDMTAYIAGEVKINDETTGSRRASSNASQVLPNIGGWYNYSPARGWLLYGRVDWLNASVGDYSGGLLNANAGVSYQAWRHVGLELSWQYFKLNVDVDSSDWQGSSKMTYSGPVLAVSFAW